MGGAGVEDGSIYKQFAKYVEGRLMFESSVGLRSGAGAEGLSTAKDGLDPFIG
jgi:hypothetical protein